VTAAALVTELRRQGILLAVEVDQLRVTAPKATLTPDLVDTIRAQKPELLALLQPVDPEPDPLAPFAELLAAAREGRLPCESVPLRPGVSAWDPARVVLAAVTEVRGLIGDTERLDNPFGGYLWRSVWEHRIEELAALKTWWARLEP
jgi:TubC N-terminal docking domain